MKIQISSNYLVFPISKHASIKKVHFCVDGQQMPDLTMDLDEIAPNFQAFVDVRRWMGKTLELSCTPEMEFSVREADEIDLPDLYRESLRPQFHFSPKYGWHNDPNGLVYYDGVYHLFYQYNPCGIGWGNMHWGYATSPDMLHWEEQPIAMHPDERGVVYSGSGLVDWENRSGLGKDGKPPLLFFYTAVTVGQWDTACQCLAWSNDNGKTLHRYEGNPLVPNLAPGNRDPKVVWCQELNCYLMFFYLDGDRFQIALSEDLLHWRLHQEVRIEGKDECPELLPMTADDGRRLWVAIEAHNAYLVGEFRDGYFEAIQPVKTFSHGKLYATQTYSDRPDERYVRVAWDTIYIGDGRMTGQMGVPTTVTLHASPEGYFLRQWPIAEIGQLYTDAWDGEQTVGGEAGVWKLPLEPGPYDISLTLPLTGSGIAEMGLFGLRLVCDEDRKTVTIGQMNSLENVEGVTMPMRPTGDTLQLRLLVDTCSVELFQDGGAEIAAIQHYCDKNLPGLWLSAENRRENVRISWRKLENIWEAR